MKNLFIGLMALGALSVLASTDSYISNQTNELKRKASLFIKRK